MLMDWPGCRDAVTYEERSIWIIIGYQCGVVADDDGEEEDA